MKLHSVPGDPCPTEKEARAIFKRRERQQVYYSRMKKKKMKEANMRNMAHLNAGIGLGR